MPFLPPLPFRTAVPAKQIEAPRREIEPGETFDIRFTGAPWMSGLVSVDASGYLGLNNGQRVAAAHRTLAELRSALPAGFGKLSVRRIPAPSTVPLLGERAGSRLNLTLPAPIATTLAVLEVGSAATVVIVHSDDAAESVSADAFASRKLFAGDALWVPLQSARREVSVVGGVRRPGATAAARTLAEAVAARGGLLLRALPDGITIVRSGRTLGPFRLPNDATTALEGGDIVRITLGPSAGYVSVIGPVKNPGLIELGTNTRLGDAIAEAGGLLLAESSGLVVQLRSVVDPTRGKRIYDLQEVLAHPEASPLLIRGDILEIGRRG